MIFRLRKKNIFTYFHHFATHKNFTIIFVKFFVIIWYQSLLLQTSGSCISYFFSMKDIVQWSKKIPNRAFLSKMTHFLPFFVILDLFLQNLGDLAGGGRFIPLLRPAPLWKKSPPHTKTLQKFLFFKCSF